MMATSNAEKCIESENTRLLLHSTIGNVPAYDRKYNETSTEHTVLDAYQFCLKRFVPYNRQFTSFELLSWYMETKYTQILNVDEITADVYVIDKIKYDVIHGRKNGAGMSTSLDSFKGPLKFWKDAKIIIKLHFNTEGDSTSIQDIFRV